MAVAENAPMYGIMSKAPIRIDIIPADGNLRMSIPIKQATPRAMHDKILVSRNLENDA